MAAGATLTLQWKMSLFRHLLRLPLSFFERRHVGDLASRFGSLDTIQKTLTTGPISGLVDGLMSRRAHRDDVALRAAARDVRRRRDGDLRDHRALAYHLYRRANEAGIVYAARENTHFSRRCAACRASRRWSSATGGKATWNNYLVDEVGAELRVQRLDLVFGTVNTHAVRAGPHRRSSISGRPPVMSGSLTVGMLVAFLAYKDQFSYALRRCSTRW